MTEIIRRFRLVRTVDATGVSGTGVVAEGVIFSDGWAVTHWLSRPPVNEPTTQVWHNPGHEPIRKVHGHNGSTKIEWLDIANPIPGADYASAWTELRGYVAEAVADGGTIDPANMLRYLDELKRRALAPGRDWIAKLVRQSGETA
jgi:hypothetical protein